MFNRHRVIGSWGGRVERPRRHVRCTFLQRTPAFLALRIPPLGVRLVLSLGVLSAFSRRSLVPVLCSLRSLFSGWQLSRAAAFRRPPTFSSSVKYGWVESDHSIIRTLNFSSLISFPSSPSPLYCSPSPAICSGRRSSPPSRTSTKVAATPNQNRP